MNITTCLQEESTSLLYNGVASQTDINYVSYNYLEAESCIYYAIKNSKNNAILHSRACLNALVL